MPITPKKVFAAFIKNIFLFLTVAVDAPSSSARLKIDRIDDDDDDEWAHERSSFARATSSSSSSSSAFHRQQPVDVSSFASTMAGPFTSQSNFAGFSANVSGACMYSNSPFCHLCKKQDNVPECFLFCGTAVHTECFIRWCHDPR